MNLEPAQVHRHLQRILAEESRLLAELELLLQQEASALDAADLERMTRIGTSRHERVQSLARLEGERADACRMLSFGTGRAALERLFDWADPTTDLRRAWTANIEVAQRCKTINDRNGAIVTAQLGHVQRRLHALRGAAAPPVYGPKGLRYGALRARDFGSV